MAKQKTAKLKSRKPAAAARKKTAKPAAPVRKAARKATRKVAAPKAREVAKRATPKKAVLARPKADKPSPRRVKKAAGASAPLEIETTSAGIQPLAPEHAAVDELTSSGNELLDIFQRYDRHRTGTIDRSGFARLLEALGQNITDEELEIALDIVDTDRTGKVSWKEFKSWWTGR